MLGGYAGRDLWVDLSTGQMTEDAPADALLRDFVGGYGIAARLLFTRQSPHTDPLGPQNIFGVTTGPLTGSPAPTGTRWTVVGKSPLTGGWGDANGSGFFGPALKQAGYDSVYFTGIAPEPVYLAVTDGHPELRSAHELWGKDSYYVEDWIKAEFGKKAQGVCIGPSGEKLSLISGVMHLKGRTAARSGLGAVMGSKRLKALIVRGNRSMRLADPSAVAELRKKHLREITTDYGYAGAYRTTGTPGYIPTGWKNGDSPAVNWGRSPAALPSPESLSFNELLNYRVSRHACWQCPIGCWGSVRATYAGRTFEAHQPEYETASAFGSMTINNNYPSLMAVNDICNRYGLDTISAGAAVAFAIECFENGLINESDTGGVRLAWGDHEAIVKMTEKLARREDVGDLLADGVRRAAGHLGPLADEFAVHVGGQELPMHDPRFEPAMGVIYALDATPGRHTQATQFNQHPDYKCDIPANGSQREAQVGRGRHIRDCSIMCHTMNASGICLFGYFSMSLSAIPDFLTAVTGQPYTSEDVKRCGELIANIRQAFTAREGINLAQQALPHRAYGRPPLPDGPTANITVQIDQMGREFLEDMGWTLEGAVPTAAKLRSLGMDDVADALWGDRP